MFIVHPRSFVLMAVNARKLAEISALMALGTILLVGSSERKTMIESGLVPGSVVRVVAVLAGGRKPRRCVVGALGATVVIRVTTVAIRGQVVSLAVACLTTEAPMGALQREDAIVIERRALPSVGRNAVAGLTIGPESRLLMVWIPGAIVVVTMTRDAIGGCTRELVVGVALCAVGRTVLPQKWKDPIVVERGALPLVRRGAVTRLTIDSETGLLMIGVGGAIVVVPVASDAVRRRAGKPVIHMAPSAVGRTMLPLEWEDPIVIEVCRAPTSRRFSVARSAIGRKPGGLVVRAGRSIVIIPVAGDAVRRRTGELIVSMAIGAIRHLVLSLEREAPIVVEDSTGPARSGGTVAARACGRESSLLVIRTRGALVVGQVAAHAVGGDPSEASASVALSAIRGPVLPSQPEGGMIERGPLPTAGTGVADFTLRRETGGHMVRVLSSLEVLRMAAGAFRDSTAEAAIAVTLHAVECAMGALETEAGDRFVIPRAGLESAPCLWAVAGIALRAQL